MIIYRLALLRLIKYFHLDTLFKEDEFRQMLLHKKPKKVYKRTLKTDRRMNLCISILLSIISFLVFISIPFAILESPCEELQKNKLYTFYSIVKWLENYATIMDLTIIMLSVLLVFVSTKTILDAIKKTNINISPWVERGKYTLPGVQLEL